MKFLNGFGFAGSYETYEFHRLSRGVIKNDFEVEILSQCVVDDF